MGVKQLFRLGAPRRAPAPRGGPIRYLHIGKTAGTQMRHVIEQINARAGETLVERMAHRVTLGDIPRDAAYLFSVRHPVARFVSGFYSRKRKGQPRTYSEWSPDEAWAFDAYDHADALACDLYAPGEDGLRAIAAIKSIQHTYRNQVDWLDSQGAALFTRPPVWILRQEHFDDDLAEFLDRIGRPGAARTSPAPEVRHANDYSSIPPLSDRGRRNLESWYSQDIAFYSACETWLDMARACMTEARA